MSACTIDSAAEFFDFTNTENDKEINIDAEAGRDGGSFDFNNPNYFLRIRFFTLDSQKFSIKLGTKGPGFNFFAGKNWDVQGHLRIVNLNLNGKDGFALIESYQKHAEDSPVIRQPSVIHLKEPGD